MDKDNDSGKWTEQQQYREEIAALCAQVRSIVESHRKLSREEVKMLRIDLETFEFALMAYSK